MTTDTQTSPWGKGVNETPLMRNLRDLCKMVSDRYSDARFPLELEPYFIIEKRLGDKVVNGQVSGTKEFLIAEAGIKAKLTETVLDFREDYSETPLSDKYIVYKVSRSVNYADKMNPTSLAHKLVEDVYCGLVVEMTNTTLMTSRRTTSATVCKTTCDGPWYKEGSTFSIKAPIDGGVIVFMNTGDLAEACANMKENELKFFTKKQIDESPISLAILPASHIEMLNPDAIANPLGVDRTTNPIDRRTEVK